MISKFSSCENADSDSMDLGSGLQSCTSNRHQVDAHAAGPSKALEHAKQAPALRRRQLSSRKMGIRLVIRSFSLSLRQPSSQLCDLCQMSCLLSFNFRALESRSSPLSPPLSFSPSPNFSLAILNYLPLSKCTLLSHLPPFEPTVPSIWAALCTSTALSRPTVQGPAVQGLHPRALGALHRCSCQNPSSLPSALVSCLSPQPNCKSL